MSKGIEVMKDELVLIKKIDQSLIKVGMALKVKWAQSSKPWIVLVTDVMPDEIRVIDFEKDVHRICVSNLVNGDYEITEIIKEE